MPPYHALPELKAQSELPPFPLPQTAEQAVSYLPLDAGPLAPVLEAALPPLWAAQAAAWADAS